jgi:putative ABC transport system permease protein
MVASEVALALMLLVCAGLLIQSFVNLASVNPGFRTSRVVSMQIVLPETRYASGASKRQFYADPIERVSQQPGMTHAGAA